MTTDDFWAAVYIAAIASGRTPAEAATIAGSAVGHRDDFTA